MLPNSTAKTLALLACAALAMSGCARRTAIALAYIPPPPAEAVIPCQIVPIPSPLTAEALEQWLIEDVLADADCELKRRALVDAWPG